MGIRGVTGSIGSVRIGSSPPEITSSSAISHVEGATAVVTVTAVRGQAPYIFSISGGADAALFTINASTGVLAFLVAPDYEDPDDDGANNVYDLTVRVASSGGAYAEQNIAVTVTDVADAPAPFGYWPIIDGNVFQDTPGTVAAADTDSIREIGNDGTGGGSAIAPSDAARGVRDGAKVTLDGSDDYYDCGIDIADGDPFTINSFFTPNELGRRQIILGRGNDASGSGWSVNLEVTAGDKYQCWMVLMSPGVAVPTATSTTSAVIGTERHVCAVWNPGVNLKLYIDGVLEATATTTNTTLRSSGVGLRIAGRDDAAGAMLPNGKIRMPQVRKIVLTDAQVAYLAAGNV